MELGCLLLGFPFVVEAFRKLRAIEDVGEMLQVSMCQYVISQIFYADVAIGFGGVEVYRLEYFRLALLLF